MRARAVLPRPASKSGKINRWEIVQAIWPFHRTECVKNEFADAVEETEPKFAAWMRKHGKQAVLKDDEVDRWGTAGMSSIHNVAHVHASSSSAHSSTML